MELIKLHKSDDCDYTGYAESRIGGRVENQDSFSYDDTALGFLVTVCDGMGGGPGGKTASSIAVKVIVDNVKEVPDSGDEGSESDRLSLEAVLTNAVIAANKAILDAEDENPELKGMGSTATVLLLAKECAVIAHVGDSRVYQFRGHQKVFRTFDHSVVFEMVRQKIITEEQARLSAQSNVITRALGISPDLEVEVTRVPYERGDRFMLCTDGIHGSLSEPDLIKLATDTRNALGPVVDNIATTMDEIGRKGGGGHDNLTVAMVQTKIDSKEKVKMSKKVKLTLRILIVLCVLSGLLNVVQCSRQSKPETAKIEVLQNRIADKESMIENLQDSLKILKNQMKGKTQKEGGKNKKETPKDEKKQN